jgi:hypothetical protein
MRNSVSHPGRPVAYGGLGAVVVLAISGALLAGCGGGVEPTASTAPLGATPSTAPAAAPTATEAPAVVPAAATTTPASPAEGPAATGYRIVDPPPPPTWTGPVEPGSNGAARQPGGNSPVKTNERGMVDVAAQPGWKVGESRPYELFVHCGIDSAKIGSEMWKVQGTPTVRPGQSQRVNPSDPNSPTTSGNYLQGTMTLVEPFLARFTWQNDDGTTGTADFAPPVPGTKNQLCS